MKVEHTEEEGRVERRLRKIWKKQLETYAPDNIDTSG
jgi:hypothetical protein